MTKDEFANFRHRLIMQAELARETGDLTEFLASINEQMGATPSDEDDVSLFWLRDLAFSTEHYQRRIVRPLLKLKAVKP